MDTIPYYISITIPIKHKKYREEKSSLHKTYTKSNMN
jgi:hypothetical protein